MTIVNLRGSYDYERTFDKCDSCGSIIGVNGTTVRAEVEPWFGKVVCDNCLRAGIVFCGHCGKPHHKEAPHKVICSGCKRVFTAHMNYDGELCPLCIQAENGAVKIDMYGDLKWY